MRKFLREFPAAKAIEHRAPNTLIECERSIRFFLESSGGILSRKTVRDWTKELQDTGLA